MAIVLIILAVLLFSAKKPSGNTPAVSSGDKKAADDAGKLMEGVLGTVGEAWKARRITVDMAAVAPVSWLAEAWLSLHPTKGWGIKQDADMKASFANVANALKQKIGQPGSVESLGFNVTHTHYEGQRGILIFWFQNREPPPGFLPWK